MLGHCLNECEVNVPTNHWTPKCSRSANVRRRWVGRAKKSAPIASFITMRGICLRRAASSGVDIPTIVPWLGHKDGGALAMKTYGHLRREHSQAQALKVTFTP